MIRSTIEVPAKGEMQVLRFEGLGAAADFVDARPGFLKGGDWQGAEAHETMQRARTGNAALVPASDKLLDRLEAINPPVSAWETQGAVAGGVVNVPAYLAGQPVNMRLRRRTESQAAPLAVVVDLCVSAGVDHATIQRRGVATLALVRGLAARRPVTLHVIGAEIVRETGRTICPVIQVDTAPLDLARAAWLLASPEAFRGLMFAICKGEEGSQGSVNWAFDSADWHLKNVCNVVGPTLAEEFVAVGGVLLGTAFRDDKAAADWVASTMQTALPE